MTDENYPPVRRRANTDYAIHDLIASRWSPRAIDPDRPVEETKIHRLLEAARWAPSAFNNQPWHFLVTTVDDAEAMTKARSVLNKGNAWATKAPTLIFSLARKRYRKYDRTNRRRRYEAGMATIQMALQAIEMGLIFHQMAGFSAKKLRTLFDIDDIYDIIVASAIGYPGKIADLSADNRESESAPRTRRPQESFAHWNGW